jgi:hypothetical protein
VSAPADDERGDAAIAAPPRRRPAPRRTLARDLTILGVAGALLLGAFAAGAAVLYRDLYSPSAFVARYLDLLAEGDAADALAVPGVVTSASSDEDGPLAPSDALLRRATLGHLSDVEVVQEKPDGELTRVTATYHAGGYSGETTFAVVQDGWIGLLPSWRFAISPLAVVDLTVHGSFQFSVNGFEVDKRQVSPAGANVDPSAPLSLRLFTPGLYSVSVDTAIAATPGAAVLVDTPRAGIPVELQAQPTDEFVAVVQERVEEYLTQCATQEVLQPTGCPFGYEVSNRIVDVPRWEIVQQPEVVVEPDGEAWRIRPTEATAHIDVDIQLLATGAIVLAQEDVPFTVTGAITVLPDGSVSIQVGGQNR